MIERTYSSTVLFLKSSLMHPVVIERTYSSIVLLLKSNVSSGCHIELGRIRYIRNVQAGESAFVFTNGHAAYTLKGRLGREKEREGRRQGRELQTEGEKVSVIRIKNIQVNCKMCSELRSCVKIEVAVLSSRP